MIHLLTCGPSLLTSWGSVYLPEDDLIVGVNRACQTFEVDWACYSDTIIPEGPIIRPSQGYVISQGLTGWDCGRQFNSFPSWDGWEGWSGKQPFYTFPNALAWCLRTFTQAEITIYGMDMSNEGCLGQPDWNFNHTQERWEDEAKFLKHCWKVGGDRIRIGLPSVEI